MFLIRWIAYLVVFIYSLFLFLPKEALYFKAEEILKNQNIVINERVIKDNYSNIDFQELEIFFDGLKVINIDNINLSSQLYKTNLNLKNLEFEDSLKEMIKGGVSKLNIEYSIFNPKYITINGNSSLGRIDGNINIFQRLVSIEILVNQNGKKEIRKISKFFKLKDGKYIYEYKY